MANCGHKSSNSSKLDFSTFSPRFHQVKTILTYRTKNSKTESGKGLKKLALTLTKKRTTEFNFIQDFNYLGEFYKDFLKKNKDEYNRPVPFTTLDFSITHN